MTFKLLSTILFVSVFIAATSCNTYECKNINPAFNRFPINAKEYKSELAKQMQAIGTNNLSFSHEGYLKKHGKEFIIVSIRGKGLCATGEFEITDWSKISGLRKEISGYSGAGLVGLQFEIKQDSTGTIFLYKDIDRIID